MAIEKRRGCGFRKVGGLYLCSDGIWVSCDRLPLKVGRCPVCGAGIHFARAFTEINPHQLWGSHDPCFDRIRPCHVCDPKDERAFIMMVGAKYYPTPISFLEEATEMGVSKRIPFVPKNMELGKTVVYLAHPKAVEVHESLAVQQAMAVVEQAGNPQQALFPLETVVKAKPDYKMGIFCAFIPQKVQKLCWESEYTEENMEKHNKRGIELVPVPDGDKDHV